MKWTLVSVLISACLICFSWFLCWEFVEAHDLHGERPQHQSTHYHSAHYHQRHRRHWVSTSEQFVECRTDAGWIMMDHLTTKRWDRNLCIFMHFFFNMAWFGICFNWIWTMSNKCNLPKLYQFSRAFYLIFKPQKVGNWRGMPWSLIHHHRGRIQTLGQAMVVAGVIWPWHKGRSIGVICCDAFWRNQTHNTYVTIYWNIYIYIDMGTVYKVGMCYYLTW